MKHFCLFMLLLALLLTGCATAEPPTVATISPGPSAVTVSGAEAEIVATPRYANVIHLQSCERAERCSTFVTGFAY